MPLHDVKCSQCDHIQELFYQPGERPTNYTCNYCDKTQDFKPMISASMIKMSGERPIETQLEQSASDGLF